VEQEGSFFVAAVKLLLCVDLLLTYLVVMRPSILIVLQGLLPTIMMSNRNTSKSSGGCCCCWSNTHLPVCVLLGLVAAGCSIFVPAFGLLSGLVGGVSQTFLAFVLPPLTFAAQQQQHPKGGGFMGSSIGGKEIVLISFGAFLIVWTLVSTWKELGPSKVV
jgi:hypothetical protein